MDHSAKRLEFSIFAPVMAVIFWSFRELFGAVANFCNMSWRCAGLLARDLADRPELIVHN